MDIATVYPAKKNDLWSLIKRDIYILNIGLGIGYILLLGYAILQGLYIRADFTNFYTAGAIVRDGLGRNLYDRVLQTEYQQRILNGVSFQDGVLMYISPPQAVFPFASLSLLPLQTAFLVWTLAQAGLLFWLLKLLSDLAGNWHSEERRLMISAVCAFPLLLITVMQGAFSLFILVCMVQFYLALKNGKDTKAGIWLAIGFLKPQNMLLVLVMLVAGRRWKTLAYAALTSFSFFVLTSLLFGWHIWLDFIERLATYSNYFGRFGVAPDKMYNFKGTLTLILGSQQAVVINLTSWVALAVVAAITFILWLNHWQPEEAYFELRLAFTLMVGLLFSTYLYAHDALLLVLPALLFTIYLRQKNLSLRRFGAFCLASPYLFLLGEYIIQDRLSIRISVLLMAVFIVWLSIFIYRETRKSSELLTVHEALS
jgi:hypothetical protein